MSKSRKDVFRKVISQAETEKPADDMASLVMQQITAGAPDEVAINPILKKLLQQHGADVAPAAITRNVVAQLGLNAQPVAYTPIISKKAWYVISASALVVIAIFVLLGALGADANNGGIVSNAIRHINAVPHLCVITLVFAGLLLVADHLISNRVNLSELEHN